MHITSAPGGGVDRYIRDISATSALSHLAMHVGDELDVIEDLARGTLLPVPPGSAAVAGVLATVTGVVHLHGIDERCRARVSLMRAVKALPLVTSLHDVGFVHRDAFASPGASLEDAAWAAQAASFLSSSDALIVPSGYMKALAQERMPATTPLLVQPGVPRASVAQHTPLPPRFLEQQVRSVVAVVGAIGPHKGSGLLRQIALQLHAFGAALVVIGYTDTQLRQGWMAPGLFIHGPYTDDALPGLLAAYQPRVALFPNRIPESFSYTLSEVWAAGIPAVVPDQGALGERVRATGGGWLLPSRFDAGTAVSLLSRLLSATGSDEWSRVKSRAVSHSDSVPDLTSMARGLAAVYARFGLDVGDGSAAPDLSALTPLLAANLNGLVFRQEIVNLCESLENCEAATRAAAAEAAAQTRHAADVQQWADKLQRDVDEARTWAGKVESDVAALKAAMEIRDHRVAELERDVERLGANQAAFEQLPSLVRKLLRRKALRGRA
jgi:glycosyltransferase involved in cell wall biosynthesis